MTEDHLFELLHDRGCIPHVRFPKPDEDDRKREKLRRLAQTLDNQKDDRGRVYPIYSRSPVNGRITSRNPNTMTYHTFSAEDPASDVIWVCPNSFEAAWWAQDIGEEELARRIAWGGLVKALNMPNYLARDVKETFFKGMYGGPTGILWEEMCKTYPALRVVFGFTQKERKDHASRVQRGVSNLMLEVACQFEEDHPGFLVGLRFDEMVLEGVGVEKYIPTIQEHYRRITQLPIRMWWEGSICTDWALPSVTRMSLLFGEDL